jgi:hypothetical protein
MTNENNSPVVPASFPNGTEVVTPQITGYINRYQTFLRKTAESIVGLATTVLEAEESLNKVDFKIFCSQVGLDTNGTTFSKLKKIGENVARFNPYLDRLPSSWTTIYKLAKMSTNDFEQVTNDLTPFITASEIDRLTGSGGNTKERTNTDISIDLSGLELELKAKCYEELCELSKRYGFKPRERNAFADELASLKTAQAA